MPSSNEIPSLSPLRHVGLDRAYWVLEEVTRTSRLYLVYVGGLGVLAAWLFRAAEGFDTYDNDGWIEALAIIPAGIAMALVLVLALVVAGNHLSCASMRIRLRTTDLSGHVPEEEMARFEQAARRTAGADHILRFGIYLIILLIVAAAMMWFAPSWLQERWWDLEDWLSAPPPSVPPPTFAPEPTPPPVSPSPVS